MNHKSKTLFKLNFKSSGRIALLVWLLSIFVFVTIVALASMLNIYYYKKLEDALIYTASDPKSQNAKEKNPKTKEKNQNIQSDLQELLQELQRDETGP